MSVHHREEVLNVLLATLLDKRGVIAAPELILRSGPQSARAMPDVLVHFRGLRTAIEGRTITTKAAQNTLLKDTRARIQQGIAHLGIAIVYPPSLSRVPFEQLAEVFSHVTLRFAVISEIEELQERKRAFTKELKLKNLIYIHDEIILFLF